ncbi:geranylgeranylglycerol-phosphate geranylgeranyltransferase [Aeropyrum camini]|uniref:(S)-2,3-di-O-farnesylgeranylglyceryl synthase n=1 Tax=Aeropyrum camini SY1 = JCM 12091 TaxID=1198449 RepID=U3TC30_9CREN|nr:geranylgeranylglycerol-phosphate geranylgeranyltransferase [Aeropyrum camini]BAN89595.1 (S)-2,3-di-O-farnesylgeranylglyceryl synthase [Aeropyrum camini SY1 = JCM 12091]
MGRLGAAVEITRPVNSLMVSFAIVLALGIASRWSFEGLTPLELVAVSVAGYCLSSVAMITNDLIDLEIDKVNAPNRPLPAGRISRSEAALLSVLLAATGLILAAYVDFITLAFYLAGLILSLMYNRFLKRTGLPGNIVVAALVSAPFIYASLEAGGVKGPMLVFSAMVFLAVLGREVAKGVPDVEGDRAAGVKTVAVSLGERAAVVIASILYLASSALGYIPLVYGLVNPLLYTPLIALLTILVVREVILIVRNPSRDNVLAHKNRVLGYMLLGLVAFALGTLGI